MFDFFFDSYMLHRIRAYIYRCETRVNSGEGEERERATKEIEYIDQAKVSFSLCVYTCISLSILPRLVSVVIVIVWIF